MDNRLDSRLLVSESTPWISIELTSRCNLRCVYCVKNVYDKNGIPETEFQLNELDSILDVFIARNVKNVCLSGGNGETTMRKGWEVVADRLLREGIECTIVTNFSKPLSLDESRVLAQFKSIQISVDTWDPEAYALIRRNGNLSVIKENIEKVIVVSRQHAFKGPQFRIAMVISDKVVFNLPETVLKSIDLGFTDFRFASLVKHPDINDGVNVYPISQMSEPERTNAYECVERAIQIAAQHGFSVECHESLRKPMFTPMRDVSLELKTRNCLDPWIYANITSNGNVYPCCISSRIIGNVFKESLNDILNGENIQSLRRELMNGTLSGSCVGCTKEALTSPEALAKRLATVLPTLGKEHVHKEDIYNNTFQNWEKSGKKIIVYPAGECAKWLMGNTKLCRTIVIGFSDSDQNKQGRNFFGLPIFQPSQISSLAPDIVFIASLNFQDEIYTDLQYLEKEGVTIFKIGDLG